MKRTVIGTLTAIAATGALLAPTPASALTPTIPEPSWECLAGAIAVQVYNDCGTPAVRNATRTVSVPGVATVSYSALQASVTPLVSGGGTAAASVGGARVTAPGLDVRVEGAWVAQTGTCVDGRTAYSSDGHVGAIVVNGKRYENLSDARTINAGAATIAINAEDSWSDWYGVYNAHVRSAVTVTIAGTSIGLVSASVRDAGFPCA